ncbi:hypothetical protein EV182_004616 [Spiromyces aspiralis]|uniref:Uncharacterized protein n=1 Tax=Spiromyces aspiralis TaxID=68401 RepID=A0ACC1HNP3_9FUNG|nr:hypothetical protein EV182_004616 [Spiromyces aspiralis]
MLLSKLLVALTFLTLVASGRRKATHHAAEFDDIRAAVRNGTLAAAYLAIVPDSDLREGPKQANIAATPSASVAKDDGQLLNMILYSAAAYSDSDELAYWACGEYCNTDPMVNATRVVTTWDIIYPTSSGYLAVNDALENIIIAFRGTAIDLSVLIDLQFELKGLSEFIGSVPSSYAGAQVHSGFGQAFQASRPRHYDRLRDLMSQHPSYKVYITGHSFGAAQAALCALDLGNTLKQNGQVDQLSRVTVYTYGEPRVGNQEFEDFYTSVGVETYRVVNQKDIVPAVPPRFLEYVHHKKRYWMAEDGTGGYVIKLCDAAETNGEDSVCFGDVGLLTNNNIDDHRSDNYIMVIKGLGKTAGGYIAEVYK